MRGKRGEEELQTLLKQIYKTTFFLQACPAHSIASKLKYLQAAHQAPFLELPMQQSNRQLVEPLSQVAMFWLPVGSVMSQHCNIWLISEAVMLAERDLETQNDAGDQNRQSRTAHLPHYLRHWLTNCLIGFIFMQEKQTHNLRLIQACTKHLTALYATQLASLIYLTFI